jgi:hypothetical protein
MAAFHILLFALGRHVHVFRLSDGFALPPAISVLSFCIHSHWNGTLM